MSLPDPGALFAANEATWPPERVIEVPGWRVRAGGGGGGRVSSASAVEPLPDIGAMEAAQAALGQPPLVMVRPEEAALDAALAAAGYEIGDAVLFYAGRAEDLAVPLPPVSAFEVAWPPLRVQHAIWKETGIASPRIAVMERASHPKCTILGRASDQPAGTAFVAAGGNIAMLHALAVLPHLRRAGVGANIMHAAARWACLHGAGWIGLAVTETNLAARGLYSALGMSVCGGYHYRQK